MPKPKDERMLYERCWGCHGTRKTATDFNRNRGGVLPAGSPCPLCEDGYSAIGMTVGQLEASALRHHRLLVLAADVFAPEPADTDRTEQLAALRRHVEGRGYAGVAAARTAVVAADHRAKTRAEQKGAGE